MSDIKTILAVIDDSTLSHEILKKSIELASQFNSSIIVLHTIKIPLYDFAFYSDEVPIDKEVIKEGIDATFNQLNEDAQVKHHTLVYFGDPSDRAALEAKRDDVSLIVGGKSLNFEKLLREVQKPILVVNEVYKYYHNVLIPTDLTSKSKQAITFTKTHFSDATLQMVYGYESIVMVTTMYDINYNEMINYQKENRKIAEVQLKNFEEEVGVHGALTDIKLSLTGGLTEYINRKQPDLVVVASHSNEDNFIIGSTSNYIAKEAKCDVLIYC